VDIGGSRFSEHSTYAMVVSNSQSSANFLLHRHFWSSPTISNFILMLIVWVRFSKVLSSLKFTEDKVLVFVILRQKFQ